MGVGLGGRVSAAIGAAAAGAHTAWVVADPPAPRRRWWAPVAVAIAVGILVVLTPQFSFQGNLWFPAAAVLAAVVAVPLALLVTRPLLAWRIAWVGIMGCGLLTDLVASQQWPWHVVQTLLYVATLWRAASRGTRAAAVWQWVFSLVPVVMFVGSSLTPVTVVLITALVLLADQVRRRREVQRGLAAEAERSELEQARRTVLEERTRIARELHDVVAHSMSLVAVRAETAPYRLADLPEPAGTEFAAIAAAARDALVEMRRLLGVLRADDPALELAPQPSLADLPGLLSAAREAGVTVEADVADTMPHDSPGIQLSAYRIVQEALSNARRHAPGARVRVAVGFHDGVVRVAVANGPGEAAPRSAGAGLGVRGMRERARLHGGTLTAAPVDGGGFEVVAVLPVEDP